MATITITPGNSFTATETVTSTKLNDLGSPTAALTAASIVTADIADDAVTPALIADDAVTTPAILDANVTFAKLTDVIDDDTMATATDTTLATSESIKEYVDNKGITKTEGSAPYFGCRAFASYDGVNQVHRTAGIGNIASVTRSSAGIYVFDFDVEMPDAEYSIVIGSNSPGQTGNAFISAIRITSKTTTNFKLKVAGGGPNGGQFDAETVDCAVYR